LILGLEHIAYNAADIEAGIRTIEQLGYTVSFVDRDLPNAPVKKALLDRYEPVHDIAVLSAGGDRPNVEVIYHGPTTRIPPRLDYSSAGTITLETPDPAAESDFFCGALRFKPNGPSGLALRSPVKRWCCTIDLVEDADSPRPTLDVEGYSCLAFLSNSLEKDLDAAVRAGAIDASEFSIQVEGQHLHVAIFRSPLGAICELLQVHSNES